MGSRVGDERLADDTVPAIDRDVVLVAKRRDGDVDLLLLAFVRQFGFGKLHRPTRIDILLPCLKGLSFQICFAVSPALILAISSSVLRWRGAATSVASMI